MWNLLRDVVGSPMGWVAGQADESQQSPDPEEQNEPEPYEPYEPTIKDVLVVKAMLAKGLHLPLEIVDSIVDKAEYWPHTSTLVEYTTPFRIAGRPFHESEGSENEFLIRTPPLGFPGWPSVTPRLPDASRAAASPNRPTEPLPPDTFQSLIGAPDATVVKPCRKIVFTLRSRDQGWGGDLADHGTYKSSWTWFEAGLERWCQTRTAEDETAEQPQSLKIEDVCVVWPEVVTRNEDSDFDHPLFPSTTRTIQCNKLAASEIMEHRVEWKYTDDLEPGDEAASLELSAQGRGLATGNGWFVRELRLGDMVTVWGKARFPGWCNEVHSIKVDVYWLV